ncbi:hypothetical protein [Arthrobacter sp. HLT1-21]
MSPNSGFNRSDVREGSFPGAGGIATVRGLAAARSSVIHDTAITWRLDPTVLNLAIAARSEGAPVYPAPGAGGQVSFAEPELGLSIAFVTNWMEAGDDGRAARIGDELRNLSTKKAE